jgi:hypothetical protein
MLITKNSAEIPRLEVKTSNRIPADMATSMVFLWTSKPTYNTVFFMACLLGYGSGLRIPNWFHNLTHVARGRSLTFKHYVYNGSAQNPKQLNIGIRLLNHGNTHQLQTTKYHHYTAESGLDHEVSYGSFLVDLKKMRC